MKTIFLVMTILIACNYALAQKESMSMIQEYESDLNVELPKPRHKQRNKFNFLPKARAINKEPIRFETTFDSPSIQDLSVPLDDARFRKLDFDFFNTEKIQDSTINYEKDLSKSASEDPEKKERFHWKPALVQSLYFLTIKHSLRMFQKKTTDELGGPFFRDWANSAKNLGGWRDGDGTFTNYVAHPMQGAATGRIFINNSEKSKKLEFGNSKEYWESRLKAMIWSAAWSTQFELGPFSEASLGNVGLHDRRGPNRMGFVDIVITPTAGTAVLIGEDIIDKYILKKWLEKKAMSKLQIFILRTFITPIQSFSNVIRGKRPWKRDNR